MIDVLLVIDNAFREYFGVNLLQRYLTDLGLSSKICSRFILKTTFNKYKPKAVVLPNAILDVIPELHERCLVIVMPSESGNGQHELIRQLVEGDKNFPTYLAHVDLVLSWGDRMTDAFQKEKVSVVTTGSPSLDHWLLPKKTKTGKKCIGFTTSLRALTNFADPIHWLHYADQVGLDNYFVPPYHSESWVFYEASLVRSLSQLIADHMKATGLQMSLRSHPLEKPSSYAYLKQLCENQLTIAKGGPIRPWLDSISCLFSFMSASMLDAYVAGIPVVSIKNLVDPLALKVIPPSFVYDYDAFFPHANNFEEARDMALASENEISLLTKKDELDNFLNRVFGMNMQAPSSLRVAQQISKTLEENPKRRFSPLISRKIPKLLQASPMFDLGARYLMIYRDRTIHPLKWSYLPNAHRTHRPSFDSARTIHNLFPLERGL